MERDQEVGVRIFMAPPAGESRSVKWDEKVLNLVQRYSEAHVTYLEHVVLEKDSDVEKYHTQLASTYLDRMQVCTVYGNVTNVPMLSPVGASRIHRFIGCMCSPTEFNSSLRTSTAFRGSWMRYNEDRARNWP